MQSIKSSIHDSLEIQASTSLKLFYLKSNRMIILLIVAPQKMVWDPRWSQCGSGVRIYIQALSSHLFFFKPNLFRGISFKTKAKAGQKSLVQARGTHQPTKEGPLSYVLHESPFSSVSTAGSGHHSLYGIPYLVGPG
jgi:hypothetical protein